MPGGSEKSPPGAEAGRAATFGVVADAIAQGLGLDTHEAVDECREMNMFLDDFECCKAACGETC